jgi:uncharacterized membrane protein YhaH (DUF805 family)
MDYYKAVLKKYAEFNGRARRAEYWYFVLFNIIFAIVAGIIDEIIGSGGSGLWHTGIVSSLYSLALIIPSLAVGVRRLHDVGKSGWMILISLIPIVGTIWIIILMVRKGDIGVNKYGPDPKTLSETPVQPIPVQP